MSKSLSTLIKSRKIITKSPQILTAAILVSILSFGSSVTLLQDANAAQFESNRLATNDLIKNKPNKGDRVNRLPNNIFNAIRQDLSRQSGISPGKLRVVSYSQESWPNGCLGLNRPEEFCTQAIVPGWRVVVSDGNQNWVYRTDSTGRNIRLETQLNSSNLPQSVANAVLRNAEGRSKVPISSLRIVEAQQRDWPNSCLGISIYRIFCAQGIVPGWEVIVEGGQQRLVYRTDASGGKVVFDRDASQLATKPQKIPANQLPAPLAKDELFRAIASGGFTGRTYRTTLFNDGRLIRVSVNLDGTTSQPQTRQISRQQLQEFTRILQKHSLERFDRLSYSAPKGAADYITVTISSHDGTIRYVDMSQDRLPESVQQVIQAWNQLNQSRT